jgi:hypothetical protein
VLINHLGFATPITPLTSNHIIGTNIPSVPQVEATLDIQAGLGVAQGATGWFWIEQNGIWVYGYVIISLSLL